MGKEQEKENKITRVEKYDKKKRPFMSYVIILFLIICLVYMYARYIGTKGFKVKEYNIVNESIPASFDGFSIVQFSDLELGSTFFVDDLEKLVEEINDLDPDVVVFTGDIVSNSHKLSDDEKKKTIEMLSKIDPLIGKYSVRGDDDIYNGMYEDIIKGAGFKDLSNSYELIYYKGLTPIVLYGLDSLRANLQDYEKTFSYPSSEEDTTYMATYRILLAHEPDTANFIDQYNISLMLAGHSHNSEINIPFIKTFYGIDGATSYYDEFYKIGKMDLYISSGLGTSKYKMRLLDRASISVFRLYTD